jgi:predicted permease
MPVLAAVVVISLGAGIGINTVVFSWMQARLLRPLPGVPGGASFRLLEPRSEAGLYPGTSWREYQDLRDSLRSFRELLAFRMVPLYVGEPGRVERIFGLLISDNYFSALAVKPALGRFLRRDEVTRPGAEPVAVISHGLWQSRFGGAPDVLGRPVRVNGSDLTIVGVTPSEFQGTVLGLDFHIWLPATLAPVVVNGSKELDSRGIRGYSVMGRLQPSATDESAQGELDAVMSRLAQAYPDSNRSVRGEVLAFWQSPRGPQRMLTAALAILQAVMLLLLLAVCGNAANLMLARASARHQEMGIRLALGAQPWQIASLLLGENILLAVIGAALGAAAAVWGTRALLLLPLTGLPIRFQTSVDGLTLLFAILLGVGCGVIIGAAPAIQLAKLDPHAALRSGARSAGRSRMRNALMAVQVGLALVVLIVAGLFFRNFLETRATDPGFRREGVLLAAYDLAGRTADPALTRTLAERLLERMRALPAIESAAIGAAVPLDIHGLPSRVLTLEGRARTDGELDEALTNTVTPGYFKVMDIPMRAGTDFADLADPGAPPQAIVNEAFVERYIGSPSMESALGRRLEARGRNYFIIGVARNSLYNAFGEPPTPAIYFSYRDSPLPRGEIHIRVRGGAEAAVSADVRRVVRELDPELPLFNVRPLTDHVETNLIFRRIPAQMFAVLGPLLLILAAIGIYAVVAYSVSLRTTEIGVRLALGATARRVVGQFVRETLGVIGLGALVGWAVAFAIAMDFVGGSIDVAVFAGVPAILLFVAGIACWVPARRAASVAPIIALRQE